jgi:hypothetical protein
MIIPPGGSATVEGHFADDGHIVVDRVIEDPHGTQLHVSAQIAPDAFALYALACSIDHAAGIVAESQVQLDRIHRSELRQRWLQTAAIGAAAFFGSYAANLFISTMLMLHR